MKVAIGVGVTNEDWEGAAAYVREAERLGADVVWSAESWGHDAVTPLAYLAAQTSRIKLGSGIMQVAGRTPGNAIMTALSLASMSHDRFIMGLGASGPQVVEGWHGEEFGRTVTRLREYIAIVKMGVAGEKVEYHGKVYELPRPGGEGKALRNAAKPHPNIPIYLATLTPKSLELTGAVADGWVGTSFMPDHAEAHFAHMRAGAAKAGRNFDDIDKQAGGTIAFGDDLEKLIPPRKPGLAFSLGAMGSRQHNFYNEAYQRAGFADVARKSQALWFEGDRAAAAAVIPDEMIVQTNLLGTDQMVADRMRVYRDAGVNTLRLDPVGANLQERLDTLGRAIELVKKVSAEVPVR
jgi:F420-dependent oxidoreductase-like protein